MTEPFDASTASVRGTDARRRVRRVFLVLALLWTIGLEVPALLTLFFFLRRPGLTFAPLAALIGAVPIGAFLVVTLRQPDRTQGAYWFLPLYFCAEAVAPLVSMASHAGPALGAFVVGMFLTNSLPMLLLAAGLWYSRPGALVQQPTP